MNDINTLYVCAGDKGGTGNSMVAAALMTPSCNVV
jgi:hypothetical protein